MKILLVQTMEPRGLTALEHEKLPDYLASRFTASITPLAIATLAALTPDHHDVRLFDERVHGPLDEVPGLSHYDVVGVTVLNPVVNRSLEIAAMLSRMAPGTARVVGGPGVMAIPRSAREAFHTIFIGEAELTWPEYLRDLERGNPRHLYRQVSRPELSSSPVPRWSLLEDVFPRYLSGSVQTTRGCPNGCEFCEVPFHFGHRLRHKPIPRVLEEIRLLESLRVAGIFLADDNFTADRPYTIALLREIARLNRTFRAPLLFNAQADVRIWEDDELLELLAGANVGRLLIGIESPAPEALSELGKRVNLRVNLIEAVRKIQSHGIAVLSHLILGSDADDRRCFEKTARFLLEAHLPYHHTRLLFPRPGTRLWNRLKREGRLVTWADEDGARASLGNVCGIDTLTGIVTRNLTRVELLEGYADYIDLVYSQKHFLQRATGFLEDISRARQRPRPSVRPSWPQAALLLSLVHWALFRAGPERRQLFLALWRAARQRSPSLIPAALELFGHYCGETLRTARVAEAARAHARFERHSPSSLVPIDTTPVLPDLLTGHQAAILELALETTGARKLEREALSRAMVDGIVDFCQRPECGQPDFGETQRAALRVCCEQALSRVEAGSSGEPAKERLDPGLGFRRDIIDAVEYQLMWTSS